MTATQNILQSEVYRAVCAVAATLHAGDTDKWLAYQNLSKSEQLAWRKCEGHAEFCRLQRLAFNYFI